MPGVAEDVGYEREDRGGRNEERHEGQRAKEEERDEDELLRAAVVAGELEAHVQGHRVAEQETDRHDGIHASLVRDEQGYARGDNQEREGRDAGGQSFARLQPPRTSRPRLADQLLGQQHQGDRRPIPGISNGRGGECTPSGSKPPSRRQALARKWTEVAWFLGLRGGRNSVVRPDEALRLDSSSHEGRRDPRALPVVLRGARAPARAVGLARAAAPTTPPCCSPRRACSRSSPTSAARRSRRRSG